MKFSLTLADENGIVLEEWSIIEGDSIDEEAYPHPLTKFAPQSLALDINEAIDKVVTNA